jgi:uroporphyrinogen decarboxylase
MHHEKSDRVPNLEVMFDPRAVSHLLGRPSSATFWGADPETAVAIARAAHQDAIFCSLTWSAPLGSITSLEEALALRPPDPEDSRVKLKRFLAAVAGTGVGVVVRLSCPFSLSYTSTGPIPIQSFMYMLYDEPQLVSHLMTLYKETALRQIEAIRDLPFHLIYLGDDIASNDGLLVSPRTMDQVWYEPTSELVGACLDTERPVIFHCCGKQEYLYPYLVQWGVQAVHPIQPGANDIYEVHREWGEKLTLIGNIDINAAMSFGTAQEVRDDTREHIERLACDGGYVVCSSHSIIDSVIPENYMAMVDATIEYGAYSR